MNEFPFHKRDPIDQELRELHHRFRVSPPDTSTLRHADVVATLQAQQRASRSHTDAQRLTLREVGNSVEGRPLYVASLGKGPRSVFLWSQMHGDESTHTGVVLDLLQMLVTHKLPTIGGCALLERCTLYALPMLNPDGAQRQTRAGAQGVDINRDAVDCATPEGRALRAVVNDLRPQFGFNLHNQRATKVVADTQEVAVASVLAPPVDPDDTPTPSVVRARQLALSMFATATRSMPGHVTRYEAGYMPTAYGEWVQARGTSTALLEAGGWPDGQASSDLVELHFVVLVNALLTIAEDQLKQIDASRYTRLPLNHEPE